MRSSSVRACIMAAGLAAAATTAPAQTTIEWIFADPGTTFTGFIFSGDPRIGQQVVSTRVYLDLRVYDGSNAADLDLDWTFPILPDDGNSAVLALRGADLGWSGSGDFHYFLETTGFNGTILQTLYGAATMGVDGELLEGARIEMDIVPAPASAALLGAAGLVGMHRRRR